MSMQPGDNVALRDGRVGQYVGPWRRGMMVRIADVVTWLTDADVVDPSRTEAPCPLCKRVADVGWLCWWCQTLVT